MPDIKWCDNGCRKPAAGRLITVNDFKATVHYYCPECKRRILNPKKYGSGQFPAVEKKTG